MGLQSLINKLVGSGWRWVECPGPGMVGIRVKVWLRRDNWRWLKVISFSIILSSMLFVEYWYHVILGHGRCVW